MKTINFAIDLGTTNSLIATHQSGVVEVYKNPVGHKETLPSVIGFRKDRTLIGDKAREYLEKDPENVFGGFKRKMGTTETFYVRNLDVEKTPIELSALVLKELKTFVYNEPSIPSVVITIPASFDTVQSNATKKAGYDAGFREVVLLQEPIAACLAFANKQSGVVKKGKWLVYDLGGGTFDVAIVELTDAELRVLDHKGDNYLGGLDFDNLVVESIILPDLVRRDDFRSYNNESVKNSLEYKKLCQILLHKAEDAKKELSVATVTEIEYEAIDDDGNPRDVLVSITRDDFNRCIEPKLTYTLDLIAELFEKNGLTAKDINQVVLVGGSTYIPRVHELIEKKVGVSVNSSVDPTTAVVVGAAQYVSTKRSEVVAEPEAAKPSQQNNSNITVKTSYLKTSMDKEELFMATVGNAPAVFYYRIQRQDGGFDSGIKTGSPRIKEYLLLADGVLNTFHLKLFYENHEPVPATLDPIEILQGKFNVNGQPLPNDICLEVDDVEERRTKLEVIFNRNSILPLKKTIYREVSKTLYRNSDDKLIVNILEGDRHANPSTNQIIGVIEVPASELSADLVKGADLELRLEISESRDIGVSVYLSLTDQEFKNVFSPTERYVSVSKLDEEVNILLANLKHELKQNERNEDFEMAAKLDQYLQEAVTIRTSLDQLAGKLNSDEKYHLEERKRRLAQKYDQLGKHKKLTAARLDYLSVKSTITHELANEDVRRKHEAAFNAVVAAEPTFLSTESVYAIEAKTKQLQRIYNDIIINSPEHLIAIFHSLGRMKPDEFSDTKKAQSLMDQGEKALARQNYTELKIVNLELLYLLPEREERSLIQNFKGTGIG